MYCKRSADLEVAAEVVSGIHLRFALITHFHSSFFPHTLIIFRAAGKKPVEDLHVQLYECAEMCSM